MTRYLEYFGSVRVGGGEAATNPIAVRIRNDNGACFGKESIARCFSAGWSVE